MSNMVLLSQPEKNTSVNLIPSKNETQFSQQEIHSQNSTSGSQRCVWSSFRGPPPRGGESVQIFGVKIFFETSQEVCAEKPTFRIFWKIV